MHIKYINLHELLYIFEYLPIHEKTCKYFLYHFFAKCPKGNLQLPVAFDRLLVNASLNEHASIITGARSKKAIIY